MDSRPDFPTDEASLPGNGGQRRCSVRTLLIWLVFACLLPGIIGAGLLFLQEYRNGRNQLEKNTLQTARALAQAVDSQILRVEALAYGLAASASLAHGDLAGFHREARQVLERANLGAGVLLTDRSGKQVLNTAREFGQPLPAHNRPEIVRRVFETGKPVVSDLFIGSTIRKPIMTVAVPVFIAGRVAYVLNVPTRAEHFNTLLSAQGLPAEWLASILDGSGTIVARTRANDQFVGQKAGPVFLSHYLESPEGSLESTTRDGVPSLSVYTRSPVTHWGVGIGIPRAELEAELNHTLYQLALGIAVLFAASLGLARAMGGKIVRSFRALMAPAFALGSREKLPLPAVEVKEAAEVAAALARAEELLEERTAEREAAEEALRQGNERLRLALDAARMVTFRHDMTSDRVFREGKTAESLGLAPEGWGRDYFERLHPEDRPKLRGLLEELTAERPDYHIDYRLGTPEGAYRWLANHARGVFDDGGRLVGAQGVIMDINSEMEAQAKLALHARHQALLLEVASGILRVWGDKAQMAALISEKVRGQLEADFCFNYRLLPGQGQMELVAGFGIDEETREELRLLPVGRSSCGTVAATGTGLVADRGQIEADELYGFVRRLGIRAYAVLPLLSLDGQVMGTLAWGSTRRERFEPEEEDLLQTIAYFLSLSWEHRRAEDEIKRLNADLEKRVEERTAELRAANRELEGFTFATSHDLKGPLGRINSFGSLLEKQYRDRLEGNGLIYLDFIRQNTTRLMQLVDDLLQHARITQQAAELKPLDLASMVGALLRENAQEIQEAGAEIRLELPPVQVMGDPHALSQALVNLLQNALKYSAEADPPVIEIGGEERDGLFRLWVRDNGIGFDMAYHDRIFEIFRRLHTYAEYEGTGVGLALVKRAMERMGGRVWAESEPGKGAAFFLEMQAAESLV